MQQLVDLALTDIRAVDEGLSVEAQQLDNVFADRPSSLDVGSVGPAQFTHRGRGALAALSHLAVQFVPAPLMAKREGDGGLIGPLGNDIPKRGISECSSTV